MGVKFPISLKVQGFIGAASIFTLPACPAIRLGIETIKNPGQHIRNDD
jgi:hypothetical protein